MKKDDIKFITILAFVSLLTIIFAFALHEYKSHFAMEDFANIASILQGTLGIAVSLAGAIVAIRLASIGTLIIEKEKLREDSKFHHEILSNSIEPIRNFAKSIQRLQDVSVAYKRILGWGPYFTDHVDKEELAIELKKLKADIVDGLENFIRSADGISNNTYSHALWSSVASNRVLDKLFLLKGGGARDNGELRHPYSGFLVEDLDALSVRLKVVLNNFKKCELTEGDIVAAFTISEKGFFKQWGINDTFDYDSGFVTLITLVSLYYNRPYSYFREDNRYEYFENNFLILLLDIIQNLPNRDDIVNFSHSIFSFSAKELITQNPIVKTFEVLGRSYWFNYGVTYNFENLKLEKLKEKEAGKIFSSDTCGATWYNWQLSKKELEGIGRFYKR